MSVDPKQPVPLYTKKYENLSLEALADNQGKQAMEMWEIKKQIGLIYRHLNGLVNRLKGYGEQQP